MSVPQPELVNVPAACYSSGRNGNQIKNITFHHACSSAISAVNWFKNPASQTSSHFIIGPDTIYCMVDTDDTAWTNGNWQSNLQSVTIEHEGTWLNGFRDENVLNKSVELVAWLVDLYPTATPNRHRDVAATTCPGDFPVEEIWQRAIARRNEILTPVDNRPEWLKNRMLLTAIKYIARDGVQLINLETLAPADARVFAQNMKIDIGSATKVQNNNYFITAYSTSKNIGAGFLASDLLDTPYTPPAPTPEPTPTDPPVVVDPDAGKANEEKINWLITVLNAIINFFKSLTPFGGK